MSHYDTQYCHDMSLKLIYFELDSMYYYDKMFVNVKKITRETQGSSKNCRKLTTEK